MAAAYAAWLLEGSPEKALQSTLFTAGPRVSATLPVTLRFFVSSPQTGEAVTAKLNDKDHKFSTKNTKVIDIDLPAIYASWQIQEGAYVQLST